MAIKGLEILLWFLIIPLAAGNLPVFETGKEKDWFVRMADALICGYVLLFAVFELLALPLIFTRQSFAVLKYSYEILACVLALAGVIFAWKNKKNRADGAERKKSLSRKKIPAAMPRSVNSRGFAAYCHRRNEERRRRREGYLGVRTGPLYP